MHHAATVALHHTPQQQPHINDLPMLSFRVVLELRTTCRAAPNRIVFQVGLGRDAHLLPYSSRRHRLIVL